MLPAKFLSFKILVQVKNPVGPMKRMNAAEIVIGIFWFQTLRRRDSFHGIIIGCVDLNFTIHDKQGFQYSGSF